MDVNHELKRFQVKGVCKETGEIVTGYYGSDYFSESTRENHPDCIDQLHCITPNISIDFVSDTWIVDPMTVEPIKVKPVIRNESAHDVMDPDATCNFYCCPHCDTHLNEDFRYKFCIECGQAIDWS